MIKTEKIPGITPAEIEALRSKRIRSSADLWRGAGADLDHGIDNLAVDSGIEKARLIELLKTLAIHEAARKGSWAGRHWLELVIFAGLLLVIALSMYARMAIAIA